MQPPVCPACDAASPKLIRRAFQGPIHIWGCGKCQLLFCFPIPLENAHSASQNSTSTGEGYTANLLSVAPARLAQYKLLGTSRYNEYSALLGKRTFRLLEIGCGACGLAPTYQELGIEYHGVDLDCRVIEAARRAEIRNVRNGDFLEVEFSEKFDVICCSQVLEHIKVPAKFMAKVYGLLSPGGIFHCDVPDHHSLPSLAHRLPLSRTRWGGIIYPHHLYSYSKHSLAALCEPYFSVSVFNTTIMDRKWGQVTFETSLLARLSPILKVFNAGSILVAVGKKKETGKPT